MNVKVYDMTKVKVRQFSFSCFLLLFLHPHTIPDTPTCHIYNLHSLSFAWPLDWDCLNKRVRCTEQRSLKTKYNFYPAEHVAVVVYTHSWDSGHLDNKKNWQRSFTPGMCSAVDCFSLIVCSLDWEECAFSLLTLVRWEKLCFLRCFQILPVLPLINTPLQTVNWPSVTVRGCT